MTCKTLTVPTAALIKKLVETDETLKATLCSTLAGCITSFIPTKVSGGHIDGGKLVLTDSNGDTMAEVDISGIVPVTKADRFLSEVTYDDVTKKFVFVTTAGGTDRQTLEVHINDLVSGLTINPADLAGDGLEVKGGKLHIISELCKLNVKTQGAYSVVDTDDIIMASGGVITFPGNLSDGRAFTVIQTTDEEVSLGSDATINPPRTRSLVLGGKHAAVTVIKANGQFYVTGDTK